jgi:dipeptidase
MILENLLKVSKPYEYQPGDVVKNINPTCAHYRSKGVLVYVHSNGDLTYKVLNSSPTYQPGDQLTKSQDQMMKVLGPRLRLPAFESKLNECVVTKLNVEGSTILAKNRDRGYKAKIQIVHELIDNTEVVYLRDTLTDWSEGMNEHGIGIVNASLQVEFDEKEGDLAKQNLDKGKAPQVSYDGLKIRTALSKKKLSESIKSVVNFIGEDKHDVGVKGQTIIADTKYAFVIEMTSKHLPVIKKIEKDEVVVRTNHGIEYPDTGYTSGVKRESSISRMSIALDHLKKVKKKSEVLDVLNKQYTDDNFLNPYRRENKYDMETTSQVMYDLDKLEFILKWDKDYSEYSGIINNLPEDYEPKIKIKVSKTD